MPGCDGRNENSGAVVSQAVSFVLAVVVGEMIPAATEQIVLVRAEQIKSTTMKNEVNNIRLCERTAPECALVVGGVEPGVPARPPASLGVNRSNGCLGVTPVGWWAIVVIVWYAAEMTAQNASIVKLQRNSTGPTTSQRRQHRREVAVPCIFHAWP